MYDVKDWAEVHRLFHREYWAKTATADKLAMSRITLGRLLRWSNRLARPAEGSVDAEAQFSTGQKRAISADVDISVREPNEWTTGRGRLVVVPWVTDGWSLVWYPSNAAICWSNASDV